MNAIARCLLLGALTLSLPGLAQEAGVQGELERSATTTPQEKLQYAASSNQEIREALKAVAKLVEVARRDARVDRLACANPRLTALRALVQVSEAAEIAMKQALSEGRSERADHEYRKIAVAVTKSRQLLAEAERCVDEGGATSGKDVLEVIGGISDPADDTVGEVFDPFDIGEDPPEVSPFL